jgi:hypothetical protein
MELDCINKSKKNKILFINHKLKKCGIYLFGKRLYNILKNSHNIEFVFKEIDNYQDYQNEILNNNYDAILYNYHPITMSWLKNTNINTNIKSIGIKNDIQENDMFDIVINFDCNFIEKSNRYTLPRPLFENINIKIYNSSLEKFTKFIEFGKNTSLPIFGSFGFCSIVKNFHQIVKYVSNNYDKAIIKFIMPQSNTGADNEKVIDMCNNNLNNPNIKLIIYRDFVEELDILKFLDSNTINIFMYENLTGGGVAGIIDYALSVNTPIAITNSSWFKHIYNENIDINKKNIEYIINNYLIVGNNLKEKFSNKNLIDKVEKCIL